MTPDQVRGRVLGAYRKAMDARNTQWSHNSGITHLLRDVKLYGRDAGVDFVDTNLDRIIQEAVAAAECKWASLSVPVHGWGRAAAEGMAQTLRERTGLEVQAGASAVELVWGDARPHLV